MKKIFLMFFCILIFLMSFVYATNIDNINTKLKILRVNYVGISPEFNQDVMEYYLIVDGSVNNLEIIAVPEDDRANIEVLGNDNLQYGQNLIKINVYLNNQTRVYNINVTKTDNFEIANANLETLAIYNEILNPEFDRNITIYNLEVSNNTNNLNILAIPQNEKAIVEITGNNEINVGENQIEILVMAEDRITTKKYILNVYKRNVSEDTQYEAEKTVQAERLSLLLNKNIPRNNQYIIIAVISVSFFIILFSLYVIFKMLRR